MSLVETPCALCGGDRFTPLYPSTLASTHVEATAYFSSSRARAGHPPIVRCMACDLVQTRPRDDDASLAEIYAGLQDVTYDADDGCRARTAREHFAFVRRHHARAGAILDIGCATGTLVRVAAEAGWDATGLDPSSWALERAAERCPAATFLQGSIEEAELAPSRFDVVTLWDTLEHVADPRAALDRVRTWLRPEGWLFLNVPNVESRVARAMGRRWVLLLREHLWYFSPATIDRLLEGSGFGRVALESNFVHFSGARILTRLAQYNETSARAAGARIRGDLGCLRFPIGEMKVAAQLIRLERAGEGRGGSKE